MPGEIDGAALRRRVRLGEILLKGKQYDKAATEARAVLERDPRSAAAHVLLGDALAGQGRCPEATQAYDEALALDPASAAARQGKAACGAASSGSSRP
jgi:cytochrome c-type biogenesis protein CcmH/NrfG